jgi:hypothetical protein
MKLKFKGTADFSSGNYDFKIGETMNVDAKYAKYLLATFPSYFEEVDAPVVKAEEPKEETKKNFFGSK